MDGGEGLGIWVCIPTIKITLVLVLCCRTCSGGWLREHVSLWCCVWHPWASYPVDRLVGGHHCHPVLWKQFCSCKDIWYWRRWVLLGNRPLTFDCMFFPSLLLFPNCRPLLSVDFVHRDMADWFGDQHDYWSASTPPSCNVGWGSLDNRYIHMATDSRVMETYTLVSGVCNS